MKARIVVAVSLNGFIAHSNKDEGFVSKRSWKGFLSQVKKYKNAVWGRTAFGLGYMEKVFPVKNCLNIVLSRTASKADYPEQNVFVFRSPKKALSFLKKHKLHTAVIAGGSSIYSEFLSQNLVDEILVDIQPVILGEGIPFLSGKFEKRLQLKKSKKFSNSEMQLLYKVRN